MNEHFDTLGAAPKRPLKVFPPTALRASLCHIIPLWDASADKPKVRELYRTLKRRGVQPWLDAEDLISGQGFDKLNLPNWEVEIHKAV
jgi:hypothetical protein